MAAPNNHDPSVDQILELHDKFESPEGHKAEVIGGNIIVSPSPSGRHGLICLKLQRQLSRLLPAELVVTTMATLRMPATRERYIPDLLVIREDILDTDDWLFSAGDAELVVEVVSPSNARNDRVTKVRGYAASGVPIYLLVDPLERSVTLFSEPAGDCYRQVHPVPFGSSIALPEPYSGKIDTSVFG
jgi:Uma2 family endonuclease